MTEENKTSGYHLTRQVECAGCAAKLDQEALDKLLKNKKFYRSKNVISGMETSEDAGVYKLSSGNLLIQTTDFFPPIVDDPYKFGQIATSNALSDIYVMGAKPITALNLCCFPPDDYPPEVFEKILEGSAERLKKAKCSLLGGHTIEDRELKFGIAATGLAEKSSLITNTAASPGDKLVLTKPLGTGIATTAIKGELCPKETKEKVINSMIELNSKPKNIMVRENIKAATDITGFGLIGHALEICRGSNVGMTIRLEDLPVFEGIYELIDLGMLPAGSYKNKELNSGYVDLKNSKNSDIIYDAQTSGGVLMCVPEDKISDIKKEKIGKVIGEVTETKEDGKIIQVI
ncbi:MAG: selenide, water dikinase SelD [Elusimicrobiota bacterium]